MTDQDPKVTPYQKSVLAAIDHYSTLGFTECNIEMIIVFLGETGWTGLALVPERVEIACYELRDMGLIENGK